MKSLHLHILIQTLQVFSHSFKSSFLFFELISLKQQIYFHYNIIKPTVLDDCYWTIRKAIEVIEKNNKLCYHDLLNINE